MAYKHPPLSALQMADMVEDARAIENLMGAYTFLNCYKRFTTIFEDNWTRNEPTLTLNSSRYVGAEAVKAYVLDYGNAQTKWANDVMRKLYPEELAGKSEEEIWGVGSNTVLTFTTPLVEVALDGQTAKGLWYIMGETTEVYSSGPKAAWNFGRCGVDFVKEDGQWKIWHMRVCTDFETPVGGNWTRDAMFEHEGVEIPAPTETGSYYASWNPDRVAMVDPPMPEPYDTFANTFSY